jgi:glycosyltransferase involved in cell wall biosynthesis
MIVVSFLLATVGAQRVNELKLFFASVDRQQRQDIEVVLVDQGVPRLDTMIDLPPYVHYIYSEKKGQTIARNVGFPFTVGRLIVLADDDCILTDDYMERIDEVNKLLTGKIAFAMAKVLNIQDGLPSIQTSFSFLKPYGKVNSWNCDMTMSCGIVFQRAALQLAGPFDEMFGVGAKYPAGDETDMLLRLLEAGFDGIYTPDLTILHPKHTLSMDSIKRYVSYSVSQGALARKHWSHARNGVHLARFGYSLLRSLGGALFSMFFHPRLILLYLQIFAAKIRGFLTYKL